MFLCDKCLHDKYTNPPEDRQSLGSCEECLRHKPCSDIQSSCLELKNPPEMSRRVRYRSTEPLPEKPGVYEAKTVKVQSDVCGNVRVTIGPLTKKEESPADRIGISDPSSSNSEAVLRNDVGHALNILKRATPLVEAGGAGVMALTAREYATVRDILERISAPEPTYQLVHNIVPDEDVAIVDYRNGMIRPDSTNVVVIDGIDERGLPPDTRIRFRLGRVQIEVGHMFKDDLALDVRSLDGRLVIEPNVSNVVTVRVKR